MSTQEKLNEANAALMDIMERPGVPTVVRDLCEDTLRDTANESPTDGPLEEAYKMGFTMPYLIGVVFTCLVLIPVLWVTHVNSVEETTQLTQHYEKRLFLYEEDVNKLNHDVIECTTMYESCSMRSMVASKIVFDIARHAHKICPEAFEHPLFTKEANDE